MGTNSSAKLTRRNSKWVIIFAIAGVVAHILPLIEMNIIKETNMIIYESEWAKLTIPLFLVALLAVFIPDINWAKGISFIAALIALIIIGEKIIGFSSRMAEVDNSMIGNPFVDAMRETIKLSFGIYVLAVAAILTMGSAFMIKDVLPDQADADYPDSEEESGQSKCG